MDGPSPFDLRNVSPAIVGQLGSNRDVLDMRRAANDGRASEAAKKFESLLATQLIKELRKGLSEGFFGSGPGADVFEGWLDEHLGAALAKSGALDLASAVRINLEQKQATTARGEKQ